jgi:hypothetical protein
MGSKRWTVYTEDKPGTEKIVDKYFEGYTIFKGIGAWKGAKENALAIEIITGPDEPLAGNIVKAMAEEIREVNNQQAVLFTLTDTIQILV